MSTGAPQSPAQTRNVRETLADPLSRVVKVEDPAKHVLAVKTTLSMT